MTRTIGITGRRSRAMMLGVGVVASFALGLSSATAQSPAASLASSAPGDEGLRLVGIGDSILTANGCPGCTVFLDQYAEVLGGALGKPVSSTNLAIPGAVAAQVLEQVREDTQARDAIAQADVLVLTIGINDVPFGRGDDPCGVEAAFPVIEWTELTTQCMDRVVGEYGRDVAAILAEARALRNGAPTLIRVTTPYNAVIGNGVDPGWGDPEAVLPSVYSIEAMSRAACAAAAANHAVCVDTYHAINGASGVEPAKRFLAGDHTHLGAAGHEMFAAALLASGVGPFE